MPPLGLAPSLGWALYATLGLPILTAIGFSPTATSIFAITIAAAAFLLSCLREREGPIAKRWEGEGEGPTIKPILLALAATLAIAPLVAILPHPVPAGILLTPPMFDHVKIAVVDAILRDGLPVPNPFIGPGTPGHLAYYYLWHVSAAMLAATLHIGGWSAEAAMTCFTAYASLVLVLGLVVAMGGGVISGLAAMMLTRAGSLRPVLAWLAGPDTANAIIPRSADIGAWANQSAWVPQHLASACCVIVSMLLVLRLAETGSFLVVAILGLCVAAGFESSVWVGGIAFAASAAAWGVALVAQAGPAARRVFIARAAVAALLAFCLVLPMLLAEFHAMQARHAGAAVAFSPYAVFGTLFPSGLRGAADIPGFWLVLLPFALPAVAPAGLTFLWLRMARPNRPLLLQGAAIFCIACLTIAWLFRSTIDNNDLGWRAAMPPILLLTACAGCGLGMLGEHRKWGLAAAATVLALLGIPDAARMNRDYADGQLPGDAAGFAQSEPLWQAVRRYAAPSDRITNNPRAIALATPWPVNIAWATLSDRPSCYAGWATAIAYGTLPKPQLIRLNDQVQRVFDGHAQPDDVASLAHAQNCAIAVITPADGAWNTDPFATSTDFALADSTPAWRIYKRKP